MSSHKPYMVIFKSGAPKSAIDAAVDEVKQQGGTIKQRFDSDIMKGFAATMPTEHAAALTKASEGGAHEHIEYVEADSEVKTM